MSRDRVPSTRAIHVLREHGVAFSVHPYDCEERGGTAVSARELGVDEHAVVKTLVMEDEHRAPLIVLMHGDCEVSTRNLARHLGAKSVSPCAPAVADRHSGYQVGGTSPFGTRRTMRIVMQATIADLPYLYINGGRRGLLVGMHPQELVRVLRPDVADIAIPRGAR
jgi:Cys-tRNA(Pro) deacylase